MTIRRAIVPNRVDVGKARIGVVGVDRIIWVNLRLGTARIYDALHQTAQHVEFYGFRLRFVIFLHIMQIYFTITLRPPFI